MTVTGWIQILLYCLIIVALTPLLGAYMTRVFSGERTFLSPILRPVELAIYKLAGINEQNEQHAVTYTIGMLLFHAGGLLILYVLMRAQASLPFNPAEQSAVAPDLSFNTAVSFITNTNWQNYGGESTMSYLVQMLGLTHQNFLSAATGIVLAVALIRGFARHSVRTVGNFWVDVTRVARNACVALPAGVVYVLLPICVPYALFLRSGRTHAGDARQLASRAGHDAGGRQTDRRRGTRRFTDRDQDARHQWRRFLQRQCGASV